MSLKHVDYRGNSLQIFGRDGDPYFDAMSLADHTNDFFIMALDRIPAGAVMLDIGANVGLTAAMAAAHGAAVYAFEPSPDTFECLLRTAEASKRGSIEAVNLALGAKEGKLSFFSNPTTGSASHLISEETLGQTWGISVPVSTVDRFAEERHLSRIDLIKLDIEGFETDALSGASVSIRKFRPSALIEFNAFTMIGFRDINPREFLRQIRAIFPFVYRWQESPTLLDSADADLAFLHHNLVSAGCVDDLYGTFSPL